MLCKLFPALMIALFSYALTGCGDDDPVDPPSPDNPSMRATIDGSEKETENITARKDSLLTSITGTFSDKTLILITLNNVTEVQTIDLSSISGSGVSYSDLTGSSQLIVYTATKGQIEIKSIDDEGITGTFSFTGKDGTSDKTVEVTNGSFSAEL
ncbi:MAG: hypothetical protein J4G05_02375 [Chlorobi bacterium]|nr:hypothetical protein [Chlorobiota bacterium]